MQGWIELLEPGSTCPAQSRRRSRVRGSRVLMSRSRKACCDRCRGNRSAARTCRGRSGAANQRRSRASLVVPMSRVVSARISVWNRLSRSDAPYRKPQRVSVTCSSVRQVLVDVQISRLGQSGRARNVTGSMGCCSRARCCSGCREPAHQRVLGQCVLNQSSSPTCPATAPPSGRVLSYSTSSISTTDGASVGRSEGLQLRVRSAPGVRQARGIGLSAAFRLTGSLASRSWG